MIPKIAWLVYHAGGVKGHADRAEIPALHLGGTVIDLAPYLLKGADEPREIAEADVLILDAFGGERLPQLLNRCRQRGQRILMSWEFNLGNPRLGTKWDDLFRLAGPLLREQTRCCDGVIAASAVIAEMVAELNPHVWLVPFGIEPEDWEDWDGCLYEPDPDDPFCVGWAAASSHAPDHHLVEPAMRWAAASHEARVVNIKPPWDFEFTWNGPLPDQKYRWELANYTVGLAPLVDDRDTEQMNIIRSDQKLMHYAMAGALPIVSDLEPYQGWRDSGVLFASTSAEFLDHVRWCATHRAEVHERLMAVRERVLSERAMPGAAAGWQAAAAEAMANEASTARFSFPATPKSGMARDIQNALLGHLGV